MLSFVRRNLDPAARLGEILFGLVMALGFTGSVRLGLEEADNRELFVAILGCNLAWAIVDGVMYVLGELFERGRVSRLVRELHGRPDDEALALVAGELEERLPVVQRAHGREAFERWLLDLIRHSEPAPGGILREDLAGGVAVSLVILMATFPLLVPFLVVADPNVAVRASNAIALTLLFVLGARWGQFIGGSPIRIGSSLTAVGVVLVLITIALGG